MINISRSVNIYNMNRLFIFLMISMLVSQSAWVFHNIELNNVQEQAYTQISDHNNEASDSHDHCGHASAHLVGLISNNTIDMYSGPDKNLTTLTNITSSISYQPPVPPPTS